MAVEIEGVEDKVEAGGFACGDDDTNDGGRWLLDQYER